MGAPATVEIGDNLVFSVRTHDPDTASLNVADTAPPYRIYEDETGTPILTGTMSALDSGNVTAFYTELIACTSANGFEAGKTYTIAINATVNSITGGTTFSFKAVSGPISPTYGVKLDNFPFTMVLATDNASPAAGVTVSARICKDGLGGFVACANLPVEIGSGVYRINLTASEMTALTIVLKFTGLACAQRVITFITQPNG